MDTATHSIAWLLLLVSLAGALPPLFRRWSERGLHLFVAVAAGIFLGTIFLHLLPELAGVGHEGHEGHAAGAAVGLAPWAAALVGLLLLFALERVWLRSLVDRGGRDVHSGLWVATYLGLSLHSLTAGVALSAILHTNGASAQFVLSYLVHKASESFSLATVMRLAHVRLRSAVVLLALFACIEPLAVFSGSALFEHHPDVDAILTGFACGTFLYVAACDLLPEVFHGGDRPRLKLAAVTLGVLSSAFSVERGEAALRFCALVARELWSVLVDMAPFLLVGFLLASLLHLFLRAERIVRWLRGEDARSVARAALIGAPLPLCSCAVVPVALELRRQGASKGATTAFLISTPETGVDSVSVSWALLDPLLTLARPVGALLSACVSGGLVALLARRGWDREPESRAPGRGGTEPEHARVHEHDPAHGHAHDHGHEHEHGHGHGHGHEHDHDHDHEHEHDHEHHDVPPKSDPAPANASGAACDQPECCATPALTSRPATRGGLLRVLHYAYVEMLDDLAPSLVLGLVLSAAISVLLPKDLIEPGVASGLPAMLVMLVIGIPLYVCASASTPIAASLIHKGLSPGAALVFLLVGPATNLASLVLVARALGRRAVIALLIGLSLSAVLLGLGVDALYRLLALEPSARLGENAHVVPSAFAFGSALVLSALLGVSLLRTLLWRPWSRRGARARAVARA